MSVPAREPGRECWLRALSLLNRREHARAELARKLLANGFESGQVETVLDQLTEKGWLSDERYAGAMARTRAASGQGPRRICVELARQGIDEEQAEAALATCEVDWSVQARALVVRRFGEADLRATPVARKAVDFLLRRGFEMDIARRALHPADD